MAHRVLPVLEDAAGDDEHCDDQQGQRERGEARLPGDDPVDDDAGHGQSSNAGAHGDQAQGGSKQDPEPHAASQFEQSPIKVHCSTPANYHSWMSKHMRIFAVVYNRDSRS